MGKSITAEAIGSFSSVLGRGILYLGAIFGTLNVATSYLVLGIVLKKILFYDLKVAKIIASALVCFIPLTLYLLGFYNFIQIIIFLGLWLGVVDGILMLIMHKRAQILGDREPEYSIKLSQLTYIFLGLVFVAALVFKLAF